MSTVILEKGGLELTLCPPDMQGGGYYRGTRFDHSGIFRRIVVDGYVLADEAVFVHVLDGDAWGYIYMRKE